MHSATTPFVSWIQLNIVSQRKMVLLEKLERANVIISEYARAIFADRDFTHSHVQGNFQIVRLTPLELGFTQTTTLKDLYEAAQAHGLGLCPPRVGPWLRLSYTDKNQPKNERLHIAMEPIFDSNRPSIFVLDHDGQCVWLHTTSHNPDTSVEPTDFWAFLSSTMH